MSNQHNLVEAYRAVIIILIFLIVGVNAALIIRIIRNMKFMWNSKKLTLISLATGDIVLVFSLVIYAIEQSHPLDGVYLSCDTLYLGWVYRLFLLNFVFSAGLIVLAIELIVRIKRPIQENTKSWKGNILALTVSAVPWILGVNTVLPVTMTAGVWDVCESEDDSASKEKTWTGVFICLPASVALLLGISVMCVRDSNDQCASSQTPSQSTAHEMSTYSVQTQPFSSPGNDHNRNHQAPNPYCRPSINIGVAMPPQQFPQASISHPLTSYPARCPQSSNPHSPPLYQDVVNTQQQYLASQNSVQPINNAQPPHIVLPAASSPQSSLNLKKEKKVLCNICITCFLLVMPYALVKMTWNTTDNLDLPGTNFIYIVYKITMIVMVLRSVVIPIVWMATM